MVARSDQVDDPALAADLLWTRRGQSVFARALNDVRDAGFAEPSRVPDWSRAHLAAHIGYQARAFARVIEGLREGRALPMFASPGEHAADVAFGASLPVEALRNLVAHAAVHLNVEWRDLPAASWTALVDNGTGGRMTAADTVRRRGVQLWTAARDLDSTVRAADFPADVRARLAALEAASAASPIAS